MGRTKGCKNASCVSNKKKITYKESESFCSRCGNPLVFVCKKCYTSIEDDGASLCQRCQAQKEDRKDKIVSTGSKVVGGVVAAAGAGVTIVKKVINK